MTPQDPTSPTLPISSPRSPHSPMDLDDPMSPRLPQLVTSFTPEQMLHRQASLSAMVTTPRSSKTFSPWSRSNGSSCRRNSLASPATSPAQAAFAPMSPAFPTFPLRTPERAFFQDSHTPTTNSYAQDGRKIRMAMRNPDFDKVVTLPLRVNTSLPNVQEEEHASNHSSTSSLIDWTGATAISTLASTSTSPTNTRRLIRSHTPAPIRTRSPIRKRPNLSRSRFPITTRLPPPPKYHVTVVPTVSPRTQRTKQQYQQSVEHLRAPLVPLISVTTGLPHPQFPTSLLQYHLLTHDQLDSLAQWYHQVYPPVEETFKYPALIPAWTSASPLTQREAVKDTDLETKRRRWGRFIGLRGCESPTADTDEDGNPVESAEDLARRMEREWRRALERAEEESRAWEKSWRGRW